MKKTLALGLILICLISLGVICLRPVKAQYQGVITINADGTVNSFNQAPIQQVGRTYTLTGNVTGSIIVNASNTVLDGNGYTLIYGGANSDALNETSGYGLYALAFNDVSNVTVKNFNIINGWFGIYFSASSSVLANNTVTTSGMGKPSAGIAIMGNSNNITGNRVVNSYEGIIFNYGENNRLVGNTIENNSNGIALYSSNNLVYLNYFINDSAFNSEVTNFWDNGSVGNFWSDYQTKYPNATKVDGSGIGNTTYVIDANNIDHYPLMPQANIPTPTPSVSEFPLLAILPLFLSVLLAAMILRNRKTTK